MNKILAFLLFPFIWVGYYVYRIVFFDIFGTVIDVISNLLVSPLSSIWLLITFPVVLIFEIPIGLIVTLIAAISASLEIFTGEMDVANAIKMGLSKKRF